MKDSDMDKSNLEVVEATLVELGLSVPTSFFPTMLVKDGYFAGWKFRYDGGHAVSSADRNTIELYDENGTLLKRITLDTERGEAA